MRAKYSYERLLNTREAAQFLRVSQASIRRWFDAGLLRGHRVGRRGERRFTEGDLLAFMHRSEPPGELRIRIAGLEAALPVHLAPLYGTDAGGLRLAVPFLAEGARLKQPSFLVAAGGVLERYQVAMDLDGVEVVRFQGGTVGDALAQWQDAFGKALAGGATALRVVGEMAAERTMFESEDEMLAYEEAFDLMCRRYPIAVLCQYDVREFDGVALLRALKAHPDLFGLRSGAFLN